MSLLSAFYWGQIKVKKNLIDSKTTNYTYTEKLQLNIKSINTFK